MASFHVLSFFLNYFGKPLFCFFCRTPENPVRRRNIAWGNPLQDATETCRTSAESEIIHPEQVPNIGQIRNRETTPADDDGFESLNSNGSSENGEENQDVIVPRVGTSDDEVSPEKGANLKKINFLIEENIKQLNRPNNENVATKNYEELDGALNKCGSCHVTELYRLDQCLLDSCVNLRSQEEADQSCELSKKAREAWVHEVFNKRDESSLTLCRRQSGELS